MSIINVQTKEIVTTQVITQVEILEGNIQLNQSARFPVKLLDTNSFDEYSFPSGHAFSAFLLTYILKKYSNVDISIIPYLVGFSRVYLGVHYPTDVIGGFLLSKIIIKLFLTD